MKIPKISLAEYQKRLTPDQRRELLANLAWCNACDAIDIFSTQNEMGYCRECYKETITEGRE